MLTRTRNPVVRLIHTAPDFWVSSDLSVFVGIVWTGSDRHTWHSLPQCWSSVFHFHYIWTGTSLFHYKPLAGAVIWADYNQTITAGKYGPAQERASNANNTKYFCFKQMNDILMTQTLTADRNYPQTCILELNMHALNTEITVLVFSFAQYVII